MLIDVWEFPVGWCRATLPPIKPPLFL